MDFHSYQKASTQKIQETISMLLKKLPQTNNLHLKKSYSVLRDSFNGGKYIRGNLILLGYMITTAKENNEVLPIAAAYEILHTSLLTLDDVIDQSPLRRSKPSVWKQIGINQALCLSDMGFFVTIKIMNESNFSSEKKTQATTLLSDIVMNTISGEMLDVTLSTNSLTNGTYSRKEKDVLAIHTLKTAYYSISGPLMLGALLGGANKKMVEQLKRFGEYLGIAFQIHDDILGVFGSEKELGKSVTSDISENKNTLLITHALKYGTNEQKIVLQKLYGKKHLTAKEFATIKNIFIETGSLTYSQEKAKDYAEKAKNMVPLLTKNKTYQKIFSEFTDFVIEREK